MYMLSVAFRENGSDKSLLIVRKRKRDLDYTFGSLILTGTEVIGWAAYDDTGRYDSHNPDTCESSYRVTHTHYDVGF